MKHKYTKGFHQFFVKCFVLCLEPSLLYLVSFFLFLEPCAFLLPFSSLYLRPND